MYWAYLFSVTGLTAYDVQKLKRIGEGIGVDGDNANVRKMSIPRGTDLISGFHKFILVSVAVSGRSEIK